MKKTCTRCNKAQLYEEFYVDHTMLDGVRNQCRTCMYEYKKGNRERRREQAKAYFQRMKADPVRYAAYLQRRREYRRLQREYMGGRSS